MNNIYIRDTKSIQSISLTRILFLIPLILYGFYKNGIYLYIHHEISFGLMFKPLIYIIIGALIGIIVNVIYETLIKKNKESFIDTLFSSFHIEYGIILGMIVSINTNIIIYSVVAFVLFFLSKLLKNKINVVSLCFIIIYLITIINSEFVYANINELTHNYALNLFDYLFGKGIGGIATTNIILITIAFFGLYITNNNKTNITISSVITYVILCLINYLVLKNSFNNTLFNNSYLFVFLFVATDSYTSSYTRLGMIIYGILIGILTFGINFYNPIISPYIAVLFVSIFNILIDKIANILKK